MEVASQPLTYNKKNPFLSRLTEKRLLNTEGSGKETRHFVVDISGSGITYTCGDSLGIYPNNAPEAVAELLEALGCSGEETVKLARSDIECSLKEALAQHLALAAPTKQFLSALQEKAEDSKEQTRLQDLLSPESTEATKAYLAEREFIDLLQEFPSARFNPQDFVDKLKKLVPRLYSIASSPVVYPEAVHLTVAIVRYETRQRQRIGVCSTYLADRVPLNQSVLPVYVATSAFGLPKDTSKDVIMVGPGTGVAPFRAFIQERAACGANGRNWLFFGDWRRNNDYLYGEEWEAHLKKGVLHRLDLAFSRDQEQKVYVQHRMIEKGAELWDWLQNGAYFYVCGDAKRMAPDVDQALHTIAEQHGGLSPEEAQLFIRQLKKDKRYQRDVY